ncbi:N-acetylmuramidase family protein [Robbsia sp. KACC 23696]|uniref:N-acetylmuramidase family protein n=1 Tax=Robbsia sp. KACC 23696 TaxID=3149231 RepID=UPI00325A5FB2
MPRSPPTRVPPEAAIDALSDMLHVEPAALKAVWQVESAGASFQHDGKPSILFERHIFWRRLVVHKIDPRSHALREPTLLSTTPGGYGTSASQHERLRRAERIHQAAARESASWGAFQIMGFHWRALRYASIDAFVEAMFRDEAAHFDALGRFLRLDPRVLRALRTRDWAAFARAYNGPAYRKNRYDEKLASAYRAFTRHDAQAAS